jgi:hypothetical protein
VGSRACEPAFWRAYRFDERFIDKSACRPTRRQDCPPHIARGFPLMKTAEARATSKPTAAILSLMLFMVIERFKDGNAKAVGERFRHSGRMLPDGVLYHASWVDPAAARCFQVMEATDQELVNVWASRWQDLVDFEVVPVLKSSDFWSGITSP